MDVLTSEMDTQNSAERIFDVGAFNYLRDHIADPLSHHAAPGARDLPYRIRRINSELYWEMTRAIRESVPRRHDRVRSASMICWRRSWRSLALSLRKRSMELSGLDSMIYILIESPNKTNCIELSKEIRLR